MQGLDAEHLAERQGRDQTFRGKGDPSIAEKAFMHREGIHDARTSDRKTTIVVHLIDCQECRREWHDPRERWRMYVASPPLMLSYCPECAEREFG